MSKYLFIFIFSLTFIPTLIQASQNNDQFESGLKAFVQGDARTAAAIWHPLALAGNPEAQYRLGFLYRTGNGVQRDDSKAYQWYALAAKQGHATAYYQMRVLERELGK